MGSNPHVRGGASPLGLRGNTIHSDRGSLKLLRHVSSACHSAGRERALVSQSGLIITQSPRAGSGTLQAGRPSRDDGLATPPPAKLTPKVPGVGHRLVREYCVNEGTALDPASPLPHFLAARKILRLSDTQCGG